ncbi:MAG: NGG1p interacting factor NIF3 [Lentisphaeria bacterium]|nr:NGG1p interacting factor NIF3 [Lentisphaerota bacterium]
MYKLCFFVPVTDTDRVLSAVFAAGGGRIGNYDCCAWRVRGVGQFRPLPGSRPAQGECGRIERVDEEKVELVCSDTSLAAVLAALKSSHPYETPAYEYWQVNEGGL